MKINKISYESLSIERTDRQYNREDKNILGCDSRSYSWLQFRKYLDKDQRIFGLHRPFVIDIPS